MLIATALCLPARGALAATADVIVGSTKPRFVVAGDGSQTAEVTLANTSSSPVDINASVPGDTGCDVAAKPPRLKSGKLRTVELTVDDGCEVETGADILLTFGPGVTPGSYTLHVAPAVTSEKPRWSILWKSFAIALGPALIVVFYLLWNMSGHNRREKNLEEDSPSGELNADDGGSGMLPGGKYRYAITWEDRETGIHILGSDALTLERDHQVTLTLRNSEFPPDTKIRIFRSKDDAQFYFLGEETVDVLTGADGYPDNKKLDPNTGEPLEVAAVDGGPGQLPAGEYRYAITLPNGDNRYSNVLVLTAGHQVTLLLSAPLIESIGDGKVKISRSNSEDANSPSWLHRLLRKLDPARTAKSGDAKPPAQFYRLGDDTLDKLKFTRTPKGKTTRAYTDNKLVLRLKTPLVSFGTDWKFTDNWVNTVTVGSTLLVALLGTSSILKAILGAEPEAALALLAVAGAVAALFVGISPVFVKMVGEDLSHPTVKGTLCAAVGTLIGSIGLITAVTFQAWYVLPWRPATWVVAVLGFGIALIVVIYAYRSLWYYIQTGSASPPEKQTDVLTAADRLAKAIAATTEEEKQEIVEDVGEREEAESRKAKAIESAAVFPIKLAVPEQISVAPRNTML